MAGMKFDEGKLAVDLMPHDVVVSDHRPTQDIQFYCARLREWWNRAGVLPALQLGNEDYAGATKILEFGASKYTPRNWELGMAYHKVFAAAMRHYMLRGLVDSETGLPHRHHFLCCYAFLAAYTARGLHQFDDRPGLPRLVSAEVMDGAIEFAREEGRLRGLSQGYDIALVDMERAKVAL